LKSMQLIDVSMLATVGIKAPVDYTVAAGKIIVDRGILVGVDEEALTRRIAMRSKRMMHKSRY